MPAPAFILHASDEMRAMRLPSPFNSRSTLGLSIAAIGALAIGLGAASPAAQTLIALPAAAGLLGALWEMVKASIEHKQRMDEQSAANAFVLSATSHMAQRAFEKHLEFAEKYYDATRKALAILFRDGPSKSALDAAYELLSIRNTYALWEPRELAIELEKIEQAMRNIGADSYALEHEPVGPKRTEVVEKMHRVFMDLMEMHADKRADRPEVAISRILDHLRDLLGIHSLTKLRKHYLEQAVQQIDNA